MAGVVRARWHHEALLADDSGKDPFAGVEQGRIEELGTPIDLSGDTAELRKQLTGLLDEENRLYTEGTRCEIKQECEDTVCAVCPMRGSLGRLCEVGVEQERLLTSLAIARRGRDKAPQA